MAKINQRNNSDEIMTMKSLERGSMLVLSSLIVQRRLENASNLM